VTFIRTIDGHFDDYMHWLAKIRTWLGLDTPQVAELK
jgi:hypothetical protein